MDTHGFALIAAGVILFGLVSKKLEGKIITAPMVFAAFGLLIGEAVFGLADLDFGHGFIHGLAEVTLILVLFTERRPVCATHTHHAQEERPPRTRS